MATGQAAALPAPQLDVAADTTWQHQDTTVAGMLVVHNGTTLDLRGTVLHVGVGIRVEAGARLRLGPADQVPTILQPINRTRGMWLEINGTLESAGEPRSIIEGLNGEGLNAVYHVPGGVKIRGEAHLRDVWIRNGTAGLIVEEGASLAMEDSRFENLFLMGITSLGRTRLERVEAANNIIGISGRGAACDMVVRNSTLQSWGGNFQMVGCPTLIEDSRLLGSSNNVVNGHSQLTIRRTEISGYEEAGLRGDGTTHIVLEDVRMTGGPGAETGIELMPGNQMELRRVTIEGHTGNGVTAQHSDVFLDDVHIRNNGGFGIQAVAGDPPEGLDGTDFGTAADGTANGKGPLSVFRRVSVALLGEDGLPLRGLQVDIYRQGSDVPVFSGNSSESDAVTAVFETYGQDAAGRPVSQGPFRYRATHAMADAGYEGELDVTQSSLILRIQTGGTPILGGPWGQAAAAMAALLVIAYGKGRFTRWRKARRQAGGEGKADNAAHAANPTDAGQAGTGDEAGKVGEPAMEARP